MRTLHKMTWKKQNMKTLKGVICMTYYNSECGEKSQENSCQDHWESQAIHMHDKNQINYTGNQVRKHNHHHHHSSNICSEYTTFL